MVLRGWGQFGEIETSPVNKMTVVKVGYILEVRAKNERELGDKLYGYDDLEAERELLGYDPHDDAIDWDTTHDELTMQGYSMDDVYELQEDQETVNDLIRDAQFEGHGVLFKTNGTNFGSSDPTVIPHFRHSAACENHKECENNEKENYYRMFSGGELILEGGTSALLGDYMLRDDVLVSLTSFSRGISPGETPAERI